MSTKKTTTAKTTGATKSAIAPKPTTTTQTPAVTPTAAEGGETVIKPKVVLLKKMPATVGQKSGKRGSTAIKQAFYAVFAIAYADWAKGKNIANGMLKNIYAAGMPETPENRVWLIANGTTGEVTHTFNTTTEAIAHTLAAGAIRLPEQELDETIKPIAHFRKNADLADFFSKAALIATDPAEKAELTTTAEAYAAGNKYGGFVCCLKENIEQVVSNVRDYYAANPDSVATFDEILNYFPVYGQKDMENILNVELDAANKAEIAETEVNA